jgi:hypothetical protein
VYRKLLFVAEDGAKHIIAAQPLHARPGGVVYIEISLGNLIAQHYGGEFLFGVAGATSIGSRRQHALIA